MTISSIFIELISKHLQYQYQPSSAGGTRSLPLSLNKFFDSSTPSMRKGCYGGKKQGGKNGGKKEKTDENRGHCQFRLRYFQDIEKCLLIDTIN